MYIQDMLKLKDGSKEKIFKFCVRVKRKLFTVKSREVDRSAIQF